MAQRKSSKSATGDLAKIEQKQKRQERLLSKMEKREGWMKWVIIGLIILVLLLILFLGYATDWTKGLKKDSATNKGTDTALDSLSTANDAAGADAANGGGGANGGNGTNGGGTTTNGSTSTTRESSNTTTTNNSTTTNNNTTTPTQPSNGLLSLYSDADVGDDISTVIDQLPPGVTRTCRTELLIQICEFTDGVFTVTTKNLLGTGIITSITDNF